MDVLYLNFEWDEEKARKNFKKHGIDFATATLVFGDDERIEKPDEAHSETEERFIAIGMVGGQAMVVTVAYTDRGERTRIISARRATKKEEREYYDCTKNN